MGLVVSLACLRMGMSPEAAILGATAHGARALSAPDGTGTLRPGTAADMAIIDLPGATHLPYNAGTKRVELVVKDGSVVVERGASSWDDSEVSVDA
jgi:imidazolonepropionase